MECTQPPELSFYSTGWAKKFHTQRDQGFSRERIMNRPAGGPLLELWQENEQTWVTYL